MERNEIVDLLSVISVYDNRRADDMAVMAWSTIAESEKWTLEEAVTAVHRYFAQSDKWLMPAHVAGLVKETRRAKLEIEHSARVLAEAKGELPPVEDDDFPTRALPYGEEPRDPPASAEHRRLMMREIREMLPRPKGFTMDPNDIELAKQVPCPWCKALPHHNCKHPTRPHKYIQPHPSRLEEAQKRVAT